MRVKDVMNRIVASCHPQTNLAAATALMWEHDCGPLPVVSDQGKVVGVITDRDICIALGTRNQRAGEVTVGEVISRPAVLCNADDGLRSVLKIMAAERVRRLPVVDQKGALVGILSLDDVTLQARHHGDTDKPPVSFEDVMNTLRAIYHHAPRTGMHRPAAA
ncbi:MAG TPA: CBS domain-containing protein [Bryobacteraceae bacterium]|nr:CBS domain-containing protein [Bryobacteraceae bacterium]